MKEKQEYFKNTKKFLSNLLWTSVANMKETASAFFDEMKLFVDEARKDYEMKKKQDLPQKTENFEDL